MADYAEQLLAEIDQKSQQQKSAPQGIDYAEQLLAKIDASNQPNSNANYEEEILQEIDSGGTRSAQSDSFFRTLQPRGVQISKPAAPPRTGTPLAALSGDKTTPPIQSTVQGGAMDSRASESVSEPIRSVEKNLREKRYQARADYNAAKNAGDDLKKVDALRKFNELSSMIGDQDTVDIENKLAGQEAVADLARRTAIGLQSVERGLSFGLSDIALNYIGKVAGVDLTPQSTSEQVVAALGDLIGSVLSGKAVAQKIAGLNQLNKAGTVARVLATRMGTTGISSGIKNTVDAALRDDVTAGDAAANIARNMVGSLVGIVPEQYVKAGVWNFVGQVATDLVYDFLADPDIKSRLNSEGAKNWFIKELPNVAMSITFATEDLSKGKVKFGAEQKAFREDLRSKFGKKIKDDFNAAEKNGFKVEPVTAASLTGKESITEAEPQGARRVTNADPLRLGQENMTREGIQQLAGELGTVEAKVSQVVNAVTVEPDATAANVLSMIRQRNNIPEAIQRKSPTAASVIASDADKQDYTKDQIRGLEEELVGEAERAVRENDRLNLGIVKMAMLEVEFQKQGMSPQEARAAAEQTQQDFTRSTLSDLEENPLTTTSRRMKMPLDIVNSRLKTLERKVIASLDPDTATVNAKPSDEELSSMNLRQLKEAARVMGINDKGTTRALRDRIANVTVPDEVRENPPSIEETVSGNTKPVTDMQEGVVELKPAKIGGAIKNLYATLKGIFRFSGRQGVLAPELAKATDEAFHELATAPERGIIKVGDELKKIGNVTTEEDYNVTKAFETGDIRDLKTDKERKIYMAWTRLQEAAKASQQERGILGEGFPDSAITRIEQDLPNVKSETKRQKLLADLDALKKIKQYVPHKVVAQAVAEAMARENAQGRVAIGQRLESLHKQRKGVLSMDDYVQAGIIKPEDAAATRLMSSMVIDTMQRTAVADLVNKAKNNGMISTSKEVPEGYLSRSQMDNAAKRATAFLGDNTSIHPLLDSALRQLSGKDSLGIDPEGGLSKYILSPLDKGLAIAKTMAFYNPKIIWVYNALQQLQFGGYVNPKRSVQNMAKAVQSVATKDEQYQTAMKYGLFQSPDIRPGKTVEEAIDTSVARRRGAKQSFGNWTKKYFGSGKKAADSIAFLRPLMDSIGDVTWKGDQAQRMQTYYNLKSMGYSDQDAALKAGEIHGAYSKLANTPYRDIAKRILFVHSFRLLMPINSIRAYTDVVRMGMQAAKGKPISKAKAQVATKALLGSVLIPTIIDNMMTVGGWKPTEEEDDSITSKFRTTIPGTKLRISWFLPNWKYKKEFTDGNGKKREVVVGINNIANMGTKWLHRGRGLFSEKGRPEELDHKTAAIGDLVKWEVNPLYRVMLDVYANKTSFGEKPPRGDDGKDWANAIAYTYRNIVRLGGAVMEKATGKTNPYVEEQQKQLEDALSAGEKLIFGTKFGNGMMGYSFTRAERKTGIQYASKELWNEIQSAIYKIEKSSVTEEERKARVDYMTKLYDRRLDILSERYGIPKAQIDARPNRTRRVRRVKR